MTDWRVRAISLTGTSGVLQAVASASHRPAPGSCFPCALGRSGRRALKYEGDGATPWGCFFIIGGYYRADRMMRPHTALPLAPMRPDDAWCDHPADRNYNRPVKLPYPDITESLWRTDHLYDVVLVPDYNLRPRIRHRGSAIFIHLARPGHRPTEGCIALARDDMLKFLARYRPGDRICTLP